MSASAGPGAPTPQHAGFGAKRTVQIVAIVLAVGAGAMMLFAPSYQIETSDSDGNSVTSAATILDVVGPWALVLALIPVVVAIAPLVVPPHARQWVTILATVLLAAWIIVGIWTVGGFYVPTFLCLLVSAFLRPRNGSAI